MMYLVLTAMLALNVSADVLNGFTLVHASLNESKSTTEMQNTILYGQFEDLKSQNPGRVGEWLEKANTVKAKTAEMYQMIEDLKVDIVKQADGADGDVNNIKNKSNLDAGGQVALVTGRAKKMKEAIELYRDEMLKYVSKDSAKVNYLNRTYNTGMITKENGDKISWEGAIFESMPVVASITLLTKVQADLKHTELEVVNYLKNQIDAGDFRVNKIEGLVISESNYVTRGGRYSAKIVLAAQDSTKKPTITVNGKQLDGNEYIVQAGSVGTFPVKGTIRLPRPDGSTAEYGFESSYIVGEPTAIISADMMNVLYAGIQNPISVSVPGVPAQNINVSVN
ncbi:MAG: gliding motility protein GldM, partial [Paludibacteraceae bacterium]|nr:gliding motility protein GldM [Paludibacteraceae bacterium]